RTDHPDFDIQPFRRVRYPIAYPKRRLMKSRICLAVLAIIMAPALASAQARDEWRWTGVVAKGGTLEVSGVLGDIQVTRGTGTEVVAKAVKHARRGDDSDVRAVQLKVIKR